MRAPCTGVILAGGAASRYGGVPKGLERVGGPAHHRSGRDALLGVTDDLLLVANEPRCGHVAARAFASAETWCLTPAGWAASTPHCITPTAAVLVVAWDMPFVPAGLLARLRELGDVGRRGRTGERVAPWRRAALRLLRAVVPAGHRSLAGGKRPSRRRVSCRACASLAFRQSRCQLSAIPSCSS